MKQLTSLISQMQVYDDKIESLNQQIERAVNLKFDKLLIKSLKEDLEIFENAYEILSEQRREIELNQ